MTEKVKKSLDKGISGRDAVRYAALSVGGGGIAAPLILMPKGQEVISHARVREILRKEAPDWKLRVGSLPRGIGGVARRPTLFDLDPRFAKSRVPGMGALPKEILLGRRTGSGYALHEIGHAKGVMGHVLTLGGLTHLRGLGRVAAVASPFDKHRDIAAVASGLRTLEEARAGMHGLHLALKHGHSLRSGLGVNLANMGVVSAWIPIYLWRRGREKRLDREAARQGKRRDFVQKLLSQGV